MYFKKGMYMFVLLSIFILTGCGKGDTIEDAGAYISTIEEIDIPDNVNIIGFGEATHGNVELQELKKDVFSRLVDYEGVYVFVLEGDFGGAQKVNQYITDGKGTPEEAVQALDYAIYNTEQMVELVKWMYEYNLHAKEDEKVYFYGNDMQRYDYSKAGLLKFYEEVNPEKAEKYINELHHVSNNTMRELSIDQLTELDETIDTIISNLESNEETYRDSTSSDAFAFAKQYANIMKQRTQLFLNEDEYTSLRDHYLKDNLEWIVKYEAEHGRDKVFVSTHNGHIDKSSSSFGFKSMGSYLKEQYGDNYFAIGTDIAQSTFQAEKGNSGERKEYTVKNNNELVGAFREVKPNVVYVDFEKASESEELANVMANEQNMLNIGDEFQFWYTFSKMFYTIKMTPNEAYDGVVLVKDASPTRVKEL